MVQVKYHFKIPKNVSSLSSMTVELTFENFWICRAQHPKKVAHIHLCDLTHSYECHDMTHLCVSHDPLVCATWVYTGEVYKHMCMCDMGLHRRAIQPYVHVSMHCECRGGKNRQYTNQS